MSIASTRETRFIDNLLIRSQLLRPERERILYWQFTGPNQLYHRDDFGGPALRHESVTSLFQVALYLLCSFLSSCHVRPNLGN